ncbi:hypothetical protein ACFL6E_05170 [Candidatus Neomarinimicrobiota bacterium]
MKRQYLLLLPILSLMMTMFACEDYVTSVDPLIDRVEDGKLNNESEVPFVIVGLDGQFAATHDELMMIADLLSDQLYFSRKIKGTSYSSYEEIDNGDIPIDNSSTGGPEVDIGRLRLYADDIVERVDKVDFTDNDLRDEALFKGYLYGGAARYYYATYFGLSENEGGGIIDGGSFVPSDDMYDLAIEKFEEALLNTEDAALKRTVNSLIARCYLFQADYTNASAYAEVGMVAGDDPYQAEHNISDDSNYYYASAGNGRRQAGADARFAAYLTADSTEVDRVLVRELLDDEKANRRDTETYYTQTKYPVAETGVDLISWQENELMLAELDIRGGGTGLTNINAVRASHGIPDLASADMSVLIEERDKELCFTGLRLVDQRRFDADYNTWHLDAALWRYLPISDEERVTNSNID